MTRVEELTFRLADGDLAAGEEQELRQRLAADPEERTRHVRLLRLEAAFRGTRREIGAAAPVLELIHHARRERVVAGVLSRLEIRPAPARRTGPRRVAVGIALAAAAALVLLLRGDERQAPMLTAEPFAQVVQGDGTVGPEAMRPGMALAPGAHLESAGAVTVRYRGQTTLTLAARTRVTLEDPARSRDRAGRLETQVVHVGVGSVRAEVGPQRPDRVMIFLTPHARATVVGTVLSLMVSARETTLEVTEGRVLFERLGDNTIAEVGAGHSARAGETLRPAPPVALPAPASTVVFSFDFEDGQVPPLIKQGYIVTGPCRPGSRFCAIGMVDPYHWKSFVVGAVGSPTLAAYSDDLVLEFDYWAGHRSPRIVVQIWNPDGKQNHYLSVANTAPGSWSHAEVWVADTLGEKKRPWQPGHAIENIRIHAGETGGEPLYVDNIRLARRARDQGGPR